MDSNNNNKDNTSIDKCRI